MNNITYITCIFLKEGISEPQNSPISNVMYHTITSGLEYISSLKAKGLSSFLIFGVPIEKDIDIACSFNGVVAQFLSKAKKKFGKSIVLFADVGLSPYNADGHSAIIEGGKVNESKSYELASKLAVAFGKAGADFIAPCLSLSKQVIYIRNALNYEGLKKVKILSYSAKFSSSLYGPYRMAVQSHLKAKDKKSYQTDYANPEKAINQIFADEKQGADIVMVKPGLFYLDVLYCAKQKTKLPLAVYHVSGEYAMIKETARMGLIDEAECFDELHSAFQRSGANFIIGYAPDHFIRWRNERIKNV